jgi:hypothetical protein
MKTFGSLVCALALLGASASQVRALEKCAAKIKTKDGTILVSAQDVSGTLLWGWTATTQIQPFFNAGTCQSNGNAKNCTQGNAGTLLAITPPPDCTLQLKDDAQTCTAYLKTCTPGKRPLVTFPTRFINNGDGTVTDTSTGLMWEQTTDDGTIRDKDNLYSWSSGSPYNSDGTAFFAFLAKLNAPPAFAGYGDWRMPTITELLTIVDLTACGSGACIDQTLFGPTSAVTYWAATTNFGNPAEALAVYFGSGVGSGGDKTITFHVRAVRGVP